MNSTEGPESYQAVRERLLKSEHDQTQLTIAKLQDRLGKMEKAGSAQAVKTPVQFQLHSLNRYLQELDNLRVGTETVHPLNGLDLDRAIDILSARAEADRETPTDPKTPRTIHCPARAVINWWAAGAAAGPEAEATRKLAITMGVDPPWLARGLTGDGRAVLLVVAGGIDYDALITSKGSGNERIHLPRSTPEGLDPTEYLLTYDKLRKTGLLPDQANTSAKEALTMTTPNPIETGHAEQAGQQETEPAIAEFRGRHYFLSNFSQHPTTLDEVPYPTVEHAFAAAKTLNPEERALVKAARTPGEAKRLGQSKARGGIVTLREGWDDIRVGIMAELLKAKFENPELARRLIATGSAQLIEGNTWGDSFWGVSRGRGSNHLGRLLMELREQLAKEHGITLSNTAPLVGNPGHARTSQQSLF